MGLDIYAGTLTRYYTRNWKTVVQQFSERNGLNFKVIRQGEDGNEDTPPADVVMNAVNQWKEAIINGGNLSAVPKWNEDYDSTPYYTDKPDWDAYNALRVFFALKSQGYEVPQKVRKGFNPDEIEHFSQLKDELSEQSTIISGVEMYIPLIDYFSFHYVTPTMRQADIATSRLLLEELDSANTFLWNADRDTILSWDTTEGYTVDAEIDENGNLIHAVKETNEYDTESLAKFAFSILYKACEFSLKNGVCIVLDY